MKIIKLTLNNFRQFYGRQKIEFSTDKFKNITLIHGENGVGKTALLNSIKWCFFKETTDNFSDKNNLLNNYAKNNDERSYYVEIEFEESGIYYLCRRGVDNSGNSFFTIGKDDLEVGYQPISKPDIFINSIIPKNMSHYFFFQGEGIGQMTRNNGTNQNNEVKKAIHDVLGFKIAQQAIKDLEEIRKGYRREITKKNKDNELGRANESLSNVEISLSIMKEELDECLNNIPVYQEKIEVIDQSLKDNDSETVKLNLKNRTILEKNRKSKLEQLSNKKLEKKIIFRDYGPAIFAKKLASQALDFINEEEFSGTIPAPYNENLVKQILEQKECICGSEISPNSKAFSNIQKLLANAADPEQGNRITKARGTLSSIRTKYENAESLLKINIKDINILKDELESINASLEEISLKLTNVNSSNISTLEFDRINFNKKLMSENRRRGTLESDILKCKDELVSLKRTISTLISESRGKDTLQESLDIVEEVICLLQETLDKAESSSFRVLSSTINETLEKFVRKDYKAKLNKDTFSISLVDGKDTSRTIAASDGEQLLLSLTFISSLIKLAEIRKNATGQILTPGAIAPFIIDAPFGVLDKVYKGNMAKAIPESVEQVVFLLSSSHWEGSVEENIRSRVGKEYNLVSEVAALANKRAQSNISIMGQVYDSERYDRPIDRTVIEEVEL